MQNQKMPGGKGGNSETVDEMAGNKLASTAAQNARQALAAAALEEATQRRLKAEKAEAEAQAERQRRKKERSNYGCCGCCR